MIDINNYILEKLKINKDSKLNDGYSFTLDELKKKYDLSEVNESANEGYCAYKLRDDILKKFNKYFKDLFKPEMKNDLNDFLSSIINEFDKSVLDMKMTASDKAYDILLTNIENNLIRAGIEMPFDDNNSIQIYWSVYDKKNDLYISILTSIFDYIMQHE